MYYGDGFHNKSLSVKTFILYLINEIINIINDIFGNLLLRKIVFQIQMLNLSL